MSDGLLVKLTTLGSPYSISNGQTPNINPLATQQSTLHYDKKTNSEGYSVNGKLFSITNNNYALYLDGITNTVPLPSSLDISDPTGADPNYKLKYTPIEGYEKTQFI
jgi:hypothetical protein